MTSARCPTTYRVHLDAGYDSQKTRDELAARGMTGEIARQGDRAPIQAGQRLDRVRPARTPGATPSTGSQRCYERRQDVIDAFFDLAAYRDMPPGSPPGAAGACEPVL